MLSDQIEQLILQLMDKQNDGPVTLSRNELADYLGCAPSQVTYVINTRFTPNRDYVVESRRGNGGYIRISLSPRGKMRTKEAESKSGTSSEKRKTEGTSGKEANSSIEKDVLGYFRMIRHCGVISEREVKLITCMLESLFAVCPEERETELMHALVKNVNTILREGDNI